MKTVHPDLERHFAEQASVWLERLRHGGPEHNAAFVAWLKESPRNVDDILVMLAIDEALDRLDSERRLDIEGLVAQANAQVVRFPTRPMPARAKLTSAHSLSRISVAAGLVVALVGTWFALQWDGTRWTQYQTARSEQRTFELADGSVINLNIHSRIAVRITEHEREVRLLEGEALFHVRHDGARPFHVYTGNATIEDVGTQFNVYNRVDGTVIAVLEGSVNVTPQVTPPGGAGDSFATGEQAAPQERPGGESKTRALKAHEEAKVSPAGLMSVRTMADMSGAISWRDRRLVFREDSLEHIAQEFNRYNVRQIRLEGTAVATRSYTGVFDADDLDSLAQVLAQDGELNVTRSEQGIIVRHR